MPTSTHWHIFVPLHVLCSGYSLGGTTSTASSPSLIGTSPIDGNDHGHGGLYSSLKNILSPSGGLGGLGLASSPPPRGSLSASDKGAAPHTQLPAAADEFELVGG